jgi:hypothetical protein
MKKQKTLELEQLEQRDTPACTGLNNVVAELQSNLAALCSALQAPNGGTSAVTTPLMPFIKIDGIPAAVQQVLGSLQMPTGGTSPVTAVTINFHKIEF